MINKKDNDIIFFINQQLKQLENYLLECDKDKDLFLRNDILKDATLMKLLVVGECSHKISDELKLRYSNINWQLIKSARNFYAHTYNMITWVRVWETLTNEMIIFKNQIENIIEQENIQ